MSLLPAIWGTFSTGKNLLHSTKTLILRGNPLILDGAILLTNLIENNVLKTNQKMK